MTGNTSSEYLSVDIDDFCFIDTETRALPELRPAWGSIKTTSAGRYARSIKVIVITYAIGEGEVREWLLRDFDGTIKWRDLPPDLAHFIVRVRAKTAWFVAFNSGFDFATLNHGMVRDSKRLVIEHDEMLDCMARASYANLAPSLDRSSKQCGHDGKQTDGKELIKKFCVAGGETPQSDPVAWDRFCDYAITDIDSMRAVWTATLDLPRWQWEEFWASERVNYRGMPIDVDFVRQAAKLAEAYKEQLGERIAEITDGDLYSAHQHAAIAQWVHDRVAEVPDAQATLVTRYDEDAEGGELTPAALGCDRNRTVRLIALLDRHNDEVGLSDDEYAVLELLRLKEYGASSTIGKFRKMFDAVLDNGRLPNQYVFNGASQTGRFSSRGVQMHNLTRKAEALEAVIIEWVLGLDERLAAAGNYNRHGLTVSEWALGLDERLAAAGDHIRHELAVFESTFGDPAMILSRLVRPAITAEPGKTLVWGDWSNIEARVLPWLAMCEERLDVFRKVDADPSNPDIYVVSAAGMDKVDPAEMWAAYKAKEKWAAEARQKGKISELSLGFGGAEGALLSMAAGYGMAFTSAEVAKAVADWRAANQWARDFWDAVWVAFTSARSHPGEAFAAGRITYIGVEGYLGEITVLCYLPDGRTLTYRDVRWEKRTVTDKKTGNEVEREQFTFARGHGRVGLWYGILVENATQATAASILRRSMTELEMDIFPEIPGSAELVAHTHDEMVAQCDDSPEVVARVRKEMYDSMAYVPDWAEGLPLEADMNTNFYYTKLED
jgi:DNA polymerase